MPSEREELAKLLRVLLDELESGAIFIDVESPIREEIVLADRLLPHIQQRVDTAVNAERGGVG